MFFPYFSNVIGSVGVFGTGATTGLSMLFGGNVAQPNNVPRINKYVKATVIFFCQPYAIPQGDIFFKVLLWPHNMIKNLFYQDVWASVDSGGYFWQPFCFVLFLIQKNRTRRQGSIRKSYVQIFSLNAPAFFSFAVIFKHFSRRKMVQTIHISSL